MAEGFWYYMSQGARHGPVPLDELRSRAASGSLRGEDLVWTEGLAAWTRADGIAGLLRASPTPAPSAPAPSAPAPSVPTPSAPPSAVPAPVSPAMRSPATERSRQRSPRLRWKPIAGAAMIVVLIAVAVRFVSSDKEDPAVVSSGKEDPAAEPTAPLGHPGEDPSERTPDQQAWLRTARAVSNLGYAYLEFMAHYQHRVKQPPRTRTSIENYKYGRLGPNEIRADLEPVTHANDVTLQDGWGHTLEVWRGEGPNDTYHVLIRSPGRDGVFDGEEYSETVLEDGDYDADMVWADGLCIQCPPPNLRSQPEL